MSSKLKEPEVRTCIECECEFITSWSQRKCSKCKRKDSRKDLQVCPKCEGPKDAAASECWECRVGTQLEIRMTIEEASWVAGYLDAEGSVVKLPNGRTGVQAATTDEDVIKMLASKVGAGGVYGPIHREGQKPHWVYQLRTTHLVEQLMYHIGLGLCERKRSRTLLTGGTPIDFNAWLAGYMEGDGWFSLSGGYPVIGFSTIDEDIALRAAEVMGAKVYKYPARTERESPYYQATVKGSRALELMVELKPLLGSRRQKRITEIESKGS